MPNFKKTRGFSLKSGNKPSMSSFKMMGASNASPITSPYKNAEYEAALAKDPDLAKHIAARDKHKKGSPGYEAELAKINAAYGKERNQDTLKKDQALLENKKVALGPPVDPKAKEVDVTETDADKITSEDAPKVNKFKTGASKMGGVLAGAFTSGLDAVYGTGKVVAGGELKFSKDKKKEDPDDETPQERATRLASRDATV